MKYVATVALVLVSAVMQTASAAPRYVFLNKAPGIEWHQNRRESFTRAGFDEIRNTIDAPGDPALRVGVSFVFDILRNDPEHIAESLRRFLALSQETGVPVLVNFDGQNWWDGRPDLWNWWDPTKPGYDPENADNVEWTGWDSSTAVKIGWRNRGSQIRVLPQPNLASPAVLKAHREVLGVLVPIVAEWYRALLEDEKYLLGGVKFGHEASIGVNAYHYPDGNRYLEEHPEDASHDPVYGRDHSKGWTGGLATLGYAAVKAAGIKNSGEITREDVGEVVRRYLEALCRVGHEAGLPRDLIYTHQGGTYAPWDKHLPFSAAFNRFATPGWSLYGVDPRAVAPLAEELEKRGERWAAVEWWWGAPDKASWRDHFERTLRFMDCRFITVYNWNCGFRFQKEAAGQEALRELVRDWKEER